MARLVIFDFDGTLADTCGDIATALNRTLAEAGLPPASPAQVRGWIGGGVLRLLEQAVAPPARSSARLPELAARFRVHYDACCLDTTRLYPGVPQCLDALAGDRLAILSNKPSRHLALLVERLGIAGRFAAVVGGDVSPVQKPDPAAVRHVIDLVGPAPKEVWMIGDSAIDVETGRAAGARTIGCAWGYRPVAELHAAGADFVVAAPGEIPPIVGGGVFAPAGGSPLGHFRRLVREALGLMPTLDLHGLGVKGAVRETERFLREARAQGVGSVRLVYGKGRRSPGGRGVLREVIPRWLDTDGRGLIRRYERRPDASGADGGLIVWVRLEPDRDE